MLSCVYAYFYFVCFFLFMLILVNFLYRCIICIIVSLLVLAFYKNEIQFKNIIMINYPVN